MTPSEPTSPAKSDWLTAADLAPLWGKDERTIARMMVREEIPTVKIGVTRYFTPECRAELHRRQRVTTPEVEGWGRRERGKLHV